MYVLFQILILVLFVFGGTMAEQYCFPERGTTFQQDGFPYQFQKEKGSMYDAMKEVGALPDSSGKFILSQIFLFC